MLFMLLLFSNVVVATPTCSNQENVFCKPSLLANHIFQWKLVETTVVASGRFYS